MNTSESVRECEVCCNNLSFSEIDWYPCPCGYQICAFCFSRLQNKCPSCQAMYPPDAIHRVGLEYRHVGTANPIQEFLSTRTLVRIQNLPRDLLNDELLSSSSCLGMYGIVEGISLTESFDPINSPKYDGSLVFVKFSHPIEAELCCQMIDGASLILNEHCRKYLSGKDCDLRRCLKIHRQFDPYHETVLRRDEVENKSERYLNEIRINPLYHSNIAKRCLVLPRLPAPFLRYGVNSQFEEWKLRDPNENASDVLHRQDRKMAPPNCSHIRLPSLMESLNLC